MCGLSLETCGREWLLVTPTLLADGFARKNARQFGTFAVGNHPANDVAAEDVDDDAEVEVRPLVRPMQFGDIPGKNLAWRS